MRKRRGKKQRKWQKERKKRGKKGKQDEQNKIGTKKEKSKRKKIELNQKTLIKKSVGGINQMEKKEEKMKKELKKNF